MNTLLNPTQKQELLTKLIGQHVRLVNDASVQMESDRVQIHCHGKLEYDEDDQTFYVRIGEDAQGHGCNGVGFKAQHVHSDNGIFRQPSGIWEITLK